MNKLSNVYYLKKKNKDKLFTLQDFIRDCFNRPITGVASRTVKLLDRVSADFNRTFRLTGTTTEALNFASYNYLGFSDNSGPCADAVEQATLDLGITASSSRAEAGTTRHAQEMIKAS